MSGDATQSAERGVPHFPSLTLDRRRCAGASPTPRWRRAIKRLREDAEATLRGPWQGAGQQRLLSPCAEPLAPSRLKT